MAQKNYTKKYNLDPFLKNLHEWIDSFRIDNDPGNFSVKCNSKKPSLYGVCDMVYNLVIPGELERYLANHNDENIEEWIKRIHSYQNPKTGWFKEGFINYGFHFKEHSTAFAISTLKLLDAKPNYDLAIKKKLNTQKKVEKWLRTKPEWGLMYWSGSHRGGGIGSVFATLGPDHYPHERFFDWYFNWLDKKADPEIGFWRIGWIHKIKKNRLTKQELGGAVHYHWIYEFFKHPFPYPENAIDATLLLQNEKGTWHKDFSYCIDLDAIFFMTRCCEQTKGYRKEDIQASLIKYLDYIIEKINDKEFLFSTYKSAHKLTGYICAIAEINKFYPELLDLPRPWIQTLDITPWI